MTQFTRAVLDHGFVKLRNLAGPTRRPFNFGFLEERNGELLDEARNFDAGDTDVANSARMSFDGQDQERSYAVEMKLNRYLLANRHMTPFESIEVWLEMKLPIFVARQFVRHRTAAINEVSARYVQLPGEWYVPAIENVMLASSNKKQGGRPVDMQNETDVSLAKYFTLKLDNVCANSYFDYEAAISMGIAMEQARLLLHVNHYTHWLWKQDLRNILHFLSLRRHGHAQFEARQYADAVLSLLEPELPGLMNLYRELMEIA
jgi:thymidylate synthase (FAD)